MKFPLLGKLSALGAVVMALVFGLDAISSIVRERQGRQEEAEQSVADGSAGTQAVLGPVLQRRCHETWRRVEGEGKDRKIVAERRDFVLSAWPRALNVNSNVGIEPRHRGIFEVNTFLAKTVIAAEFADLSGLQARAEQPDGQVQCEPATVAVALSDARGIQAATITAGEERLAILPGSLLDHHERGFHALLPDRMAAAATPCTSTSRSTWPERAAWPGFPSVTRRRSS